MSEEERPPLSSGETADKVVNSTESGGKYLPMDPKALSRRTLPGIVEGVLAGLRGRSRVDTGKESGGGRMDPTELSGGTVSGIVEGIRAGFRGGRKPQKPNK